MGRHKIKRIEIAEIRAEEIVKKVPRAHGNGARVMVPRHWVGREIYLVLPQRDKNLQFVEYTLGQGMVLLSEASKRDDVEKDPLLLDSMFTTFIILSGFVDDDLYEISDELELEIHDTIKKLDDVLRPTGYLGGE